MNSVIFCDNGQILLNSAAYCNRYEDVQLAVRDWINLAGMNACEGYEGARYLLTTDTRYSRLFTEDDVRDVRKGRVSKMSVGPQWRNTEEFFKVLAEEFPWLS